MRRRAPNAAEARATGGTVFWTRHRRSPDLVPTICDWFAESGFEPVTVSAPADGVGVGVHRFVGTPRPLPPGVTMFEFVGNDRPPGPA